jgi:hypothetical protein
MTNKNDPLFESAISRIAEQIMSEKKLKDHGFGHVRRVVEYGKMIMKAEQIETSDNILAALYCHDIGRTDDAVDDGHGEKGTAIFKDRIYPLFPHLDVKTISFAIGNHQSYTRPLVWQHDTNGIDTAVPIVLWDADRLDLQRLEEFRGKIDPNYLHTNFAKRFANTEEHMEIYNNSNNK